MSDQSLFIAMVFLVGFLMTQAFVSPLMGSSARARRRLRDRVRDLSSDADAQQHLSLVREKYLRDLSPLERKLLVVPGVEHLQALLDQAGSSRTPTRVLATCLGAAAATALAAASVLGWGVGALLIAALAGAIPILLLKRKRQRRLTKFEEQLPDALTVAARALRAGVPFSEALNLVSQEMAEPVGKEFGVVFTEINYGGDVRRALLGLLERVPNVAVMAMVTSVLIQRDTGGNLAEVLDKLSGVVRERFRFQRALRTLTAEGRLSAWILSLLPFFMAAALTAIDPEFIPRLTQDPFGRKLVFVAFAMLIAGILWMRRIVRIDV
jgi:tight adherence protein B